MVPWQGWRAPVMRWRRVDLPAPLAPRMATRESMLMEQEMRKEGEGGMGKEREVLLDTEREIFVKIIFFLA